MTASPPKPWERANGDAATVTATSASSNGPAAIQGPSTPSGTVSATTSATTPGVPARPTAITSSATSTAYNRGGLGYGRSPYSYSSPYNTYGSYGSPYNAYGSGYGYGSYGGYGSPYGSYGTGYSRFGSMYGASPFNTENNSLMSQMEQSTAATFQILESVVMAFGGFAHMLESTYQATHASFMAMVGVADHVGNLRSYLSSIFSLAALLNLFKDLINTAKRIMCKVTGTQYLITDSTTTSDALTKEFMSSSSAANQKPSASRKPFLIFVLLTFGVPYLFNKLLNRLRSTMPQYQLLQQDELLTPEQISQLPFARVKYDFKAQEQSDLELRAGDIVAVLSTTVPTLPSTSTAPASDTTNGAPDAPKEDPALAIAPSDTPQQQESEWWKGRTEDGRIGWFPKAFVEVIDRKRS